MRHFYTSIDVSGHSEIAIGKLGTSVYISYLDDFLCLDGFSLLNGFLASGFLVLDGFSHLNDFWRVNGFRVSMVFCIWMDFSRLDGILLD